MGEIIWPDWVYYDESSPSCLRWKVDIRTGSGGRILRIAAGTVAGCKCEGGWRITLKRKGYFVHRLIVEMSSGPIQEGLMVDHKNGDPYDNRVCNLHVVTPADNSRNNKKSVRNTSGVTGVSYSERVVNGKLYAYWRVDWTDKELRHRAKQFSVAKLGYSVAFELAKSFREAKIAERIEEGALYSETHGKR